MYGFYTEETKCIEQVSQFKKTAHRNNIIKIMNDCARHRRSGGILDCFGCDALSHCRIGQSNQVSEFEIPNKGLN